VRIDSQTSLTVNVDLFASPERADTRVAAGGVPAQAVFCLESGGDPPAAYVDGGSGLNLRVHAVQIIVRSNPRDYAGGKSLANSVRNAVHEAPIAGYLDVRVREAQPNYLGEDEKGCHRWSINVQLQIKE
jgi:hypothetical protein